MVIWITGLSCSGKTTIGRALYNAWKPSNPALVWLDGDKLRETFASQAGHSAEERLRLGLMYANMCKMFAEQGIDIIVSTVGLRNELREQNYANIPDYREILVTASLDTLRQRDRKGLYGENTANVMGVDIVPEYPPNPDMVITNEGAQAPEEIAAEILATLLSKRSVQKSPRPMKASRLLQFIADLGIVVIAGVPDSTLKEFCDAVSAVKSGFAHYAAPNEGAAVGIAVGSYLSTGSPACVYMQNSGIGNAANPITSIANAEVCNIPMLFVIGYRGSPESPDEPQHRFMGRITEEMLDCMEIKHAVIDCGTTEAQLESIFLDASDCLKNKKQFALLIKRGTFAKCENAGYANDYTLSREYVIAEILKEAANDLIVSTTGKISREVYENSNRISGHHKQCFLTVGGMGHASMIAFGVAQNCRGKRVICMDGDGAVLMHMGSLAFIGARTPQNFIHICLNNGAHESVGGMPTSSPGLDYAEVAKACGYSAVMLIRTEAEFNEFINNFSSLKGLAFIEIKVANASRDDLGRPKESAADNAIEFMDNIREGQERL